MSILVDTDVTGDQELDEALCQDINEVLKENSISDLFVFLRIVSSQWYANDNENHHFGNIK